MGIMNYAIKDRDGTIHDEPSWKQAMHERKAYGGVLVQRKAARVNGSHTRMVAEGRSA